MPHRTILISGDGAAPKTTEASIRILEATGVQLEGGPAIGQLSQLDELGRRRRISEDFPLSTTGGPSDRLCADTHTTERQ